MSRPELVAELQRSPEHVYEWLLAEARYHADQIRGFYEGLVAAVEWWKGRKFGNPHRFPWELEPWEIEYRTTGKVADASSEIKGENRVK